MLARLRVVLTAAVTYLVAIAAILVIVIDELGGVAGIPPLVVKVLGTTLAVVGVAITIIRRVTVVLPQARGLLDNGNARTDLELIAVQSTHPSTPAKPDSSSELEDFPGEFA